MFEHGGPLASPAGDAAGASAMVNPSARSASTRKRFIQSPFWRPRSIEVEVRLVHRAVRQREVEDVAPGRSRRRPVVDELLVIRVIAEDRSSSRKRDCRSERLREVAIGALEREAVDSL